jgi:hypothetical protein
VARVSGQGAGNRGGEGDGGNRSISNGGNNDGFDEDGEELTSVAETGEAGDDNGVTGVEDGGKGGAENV